jgi:cytochrome c peroxidase
MARYLFIVSALSLLIFSLSFTNVPDLTAAQRVKKSYLEKLDSLIVEIKELGIAASAEDNRKLQTQFLTVRACYKKIESLIGYYFDSYVARLNGPPIPYFEESEAYIMENEALGMQVIEGFIFQKQNSGYDSALKYQMDELLRYAVELSSVHEAMDITDANLFDAFIEEVYRITALGITGFDSQTAQQSLPECTAALEGLLHFITFYQSLFEEKMPGAYQQLESLFKDAVSYLEKNSQFNRFDRLTFIVKYLNPITKIIGDFKIINDWSDNKSAHYLSAIRKNGTLFNPGAFNVFRFLGDFTTTSKKVEFGRQLFFEKQLSSNNKQSCAGCHQPEKAFTDGLKTSEALDGHSVLKRNAPTIWNAALQRNLFADNRGRGLEDQVLQVLNNSKEMHGSAKAVAEKVLNMKKYSDIYKEAYPNAKAEDAVNNICNAIACYERTLIALNSKFDKHMHGEDAINKNEKNGFNLFMGKAKCGTCHFMPLFSGAKPPRYFYIESEVLGVPSSADKKYARLDIDSGRYLITQSPVHLFSFKTPSLRNVALTAPYMHNGVFKTLEEVVDFYNNGGGQGLGIAPSNQTLPFEKLNLTKKEKKDLIAFMKTLTDTTSAHIAAD